MTNQIKALRAEIERLRRETDGSQFDIGQRYACNQIIAFIDTLDEPSHIGEGETVAASTKDELEEEIEKRYEQARTVGYIDGIGPIELDKDAFKRIARHFAEWGAEH